MYMVLSDIQIPSNYGVAIEFNIPQTSKHVDFILTGFDDKLEDQAVLKQWSKDKPVSNIEALLKAGSMGIDNKVQTKPLVSTSKEISPNTK